MNTLNIWTLIIIVGLMGALLGAMLIGIIWAIVHLNSKRKLIIANFPEIPGLPIHFERRRLPGGFFDRKSQEPTATRNDQDRILPSSPATYPSNWGPVNCIGAGGFTIVAPSKLEAAKTIEGLYAAEWIANNKRLPTPTEAKDGGFAQGLAKAIEDGKRLATRFMVWDPLAYRKASRESVMQKLYQSAGTGDDPWYAKPLVVIGIIAIVGILAVLGVLVVKVLPILQAAGS